MAQACSGPSILLSLFAVAQACCSRMTRLSVSHAISKLSFYDFVAKPKSPFSVWWLYAFFFVSWIKQLQNISVIMSDVIRLFKKYFAFIDRNLKFNLTHDFLKWLFISNDENRIKLCLIECKLSISRGSLEEINSNAWN